MKIEFDPAKDASNSRKHGVSLARASELDWGTAQVEEDNRFDYAEDRFIGYALLGDRLYCVAFTYRNDVIRVISLRKANRREVQRYEQQT
ncbi:BrnT family toxin [Trinickia fusca]|uniref:BrnT family toxin n=1 Tax=Trinickia fusca TaxID=2419777 RepID=A0A494X2M4_9BURK|nr:BrnT family toxin [Trinickia fusca]RKP44958.1 BrnT family toxin [Trinickia fusca]